MKTIARHLDNVTSLSYSNKDGGTRSTALNKLPLDILKFCQNHCITLFLSYLPEWRIWEQIPSQWDRFWGNGSWIPAWWSTYSRNLGDLMGIGSPPGGQLFSPSTSLWVKEIGSQQDSMPWIRTETSRGCMFSLHLSWFLQPFQAWIYHCHLYPLQAANCCRNSRLVVNKDDLKWVKNVRKLPCISKSFIDIFLLKPLSFSKIKSVFRDLRWCFNASWGIKGLIKAKLGRCRVGLIMITLFWTESAWLPELPQLSMLPPFRLPDRPNAVADLISGNPLPSPSELRLTA